MTKHGLTLFEWMELHFIPEPNSGCWLWIGGINTKGYGQITVNNKSRRAHRVMFELHNGKIPKGMEVCHSCDIKCCVNPDHLSLHAYPVDTYSYPC